METDVSVIATPDIAEVLPNTVEQEGEFSGSESEAQTVSVSVRSIPNVLVATSQGLFTAGQLQEAGIKTTHIVIHDQTTLDSVLKAQQSSISSGSSVSLIAEPRKFKYNWHPSVHDPVLPVRCRNISGELHKNRFGSGGKGRCIKVNSVWYSPTEFEAISGRANSKDWKRSIRYAGRTLYCLIEEGILQPHATSCTCSACCDDTTISGPVRLFTPYKRKRKEDPTKPSVSPIEKSSDSLDKDSSMVVTVTSPESPASHIRESLTVVTASESSLVDSLAGTSIITTDDGTEAVLVTPVPQQSVSRTVPVDFSEQRHWWQLEEMVKNLTRQVQELQKQIDAVRVQSTESREAALQQLRLQMENEKKEALNTSRIEAQMNLSRAILEARAEKEIAVQQALQQARLELKEQENIATKQDSPTGKFCVNCNRESVFECTGCHTVTYCSTFCQQRDWPSHREVCQEEMEASVVEK